MLQLGLLGPVTVQAEGQAVEVRRPLELALLARLALSPGHMVPTDRILGDLWAERQPGDPLGSLHALVYRLRRALGPAGQALRRDASGYKLVVSAEDVDASRFHDLLAKARAGPADAGPGARRSLLVAALGLWRGPALAGLEAVPFVDAQRVRLEAAYLTALEERVDADLDCGADREVVSELEGLVADHPFRERFWAQLVTALYRSGSQTDALRACAKLRELLVDQLGVEPSPMVRALEQAVLRQDPALDWHEPGGAFRSEEPGATTAPISGTSTEPLPVVDVASRPAKPPKVTTNLPVAISRFIGRAEELATVRKLVTDNRLLTLTGPGGVGKTRLAVEVASKMYDRFADGVWLVDLAPLREPQLVPGALASTLGVTISPDRPVLDSLSQFVAGRHLLLVLDNCDHLLLPVAEVVKVLLGRSALVVALVTSREPLRSEGEVVWRVPVLSLPGEGAVADLQGTFGSDAVRLFVDRALSARPQLPITDDEAPALAEVVRRLDGLPLAIELAASRLGTLGLADLVRRLDQRLDLLKKGLRGAPLRHQALAATIEWSYQLLDEEAQLAFRHLSVFASSFSLEGAMAVLSAETAPGAAFEVLSDLVAKSLVVLIDTAGESRYRLLETVREYAAGLLDSCGESDGARHRLLAWATALAEQAGEGTQGITASVWLDRIDLELGNVREALRWALSGGSPELGLRVSTSLVWFWTGRGHVAEGLGLLDRLLASPDVGRGPLRALAFAAAGFLASEQRSNEEAAALGEQAVAIARETGDLAALGWALLSLGNSLVPAARFEDARTHLEEALALGEQTGQRAVVELAESVLTGVDFASDNHAEAMRRAERCIASGRASGNLRVLSLALLLQGEMKEDAGDYTMAMDLFREALECTRQLGDISGVAAALRTISYCLFAQGHFEEARSYCEDSLALFDRGQHGMEVWYALGLLQLSDLHFELGDYSTARALLDDARLQTTGHGHVGSRRYTMLLAGNLAQVEGDRRAALDLHRKALRSSLARREVLWCLEAFATSLKYNGEDSEAVVLLACEDKTRRDIGSSVYPYQRQRRAQLLEDLKDALGQAAFDCAWAEGQVLPIENAKSRALAIATALLST